MNIRKTTLWISLLTLGLFFVSCATVSAEVIKSFDSKIIVNIENSVTVIETIQYDSEGIEKHGIYRDIRPISSTNTPMDIINISITDLDGVPIKWQKQTNNGNIRLRIGDPNVTFQGLKSYVIRYTATNAIAHIEDVDQIHWNVTGNAWDFNIEQSTAKITLPETSNMLRHTCSIGPIKENDYCYLDLADNYFISSHAIAPGSYMSVSVTFPSGFVFDPVLTVKQKIINFIAKFWPITIPVLVFIIEFTIWYKRGRDPKGSGIIISQYEVPDQLTPLEASVILNQKFSQKDITAEIMHLAVLGYIRIHQELTKKILNTFISKKVQYVLTLLKVPGDELPAFDKQLLTEIFCQSNANTPLKVGNTFNLSGKININKLTKLIDKTIKKQLVENNYYTKHFMKYGRGVSLWGIAIVLLFLPEMLSILKPFVNQTNIANVFNAISLGSTVTIIVFLFSILATFIIMALFHPLIPAKTQKGVSAKEHLLGLKEYIKVAEKERIAFHNAPEMKPVLFEKLLPFAIIFGLEKKWAKAFEGIMVESPVWYSGTASFNPILFTKDFSSNFSSSLFMESGGGGGGFSGGGGGGGGGGSW